MHHISVGSFMDWRNLALMGCVLSVISELALYFSPETPRYYILKGKQQVSNSYLFQQCAHFIDILILNQT